MWINKKFIYFSGNQQSISSFIEIKKPEKLHSNERKEREKKKERGEEKEEKKKKAMVTLLVLYDNGYFIIIIRMLHLAYRLSGIKSGW